MIDKGELAKVYIKAQADGTDDSIALLEPHLADDVLLTMALGPVDGKQAVLTQMKNPVTMYNFTVGTWTEPVADGDAVKMASTMPIQATLGGFNLTFNYTPDGKLHRVLMQPFPAPPMPVSALQLTDEIKQIVNEAPTKGLSLLVAAVDLDGQPRLSLRGSLSVLSDTQLCFWARNLEGRTAQGLEKNPRLTLWYRDAPNRLNFTFYGRGRIASDDATRQKVYDQAIESERKADAQMKGGAVVVDLTAVEGVAPQRPGEYEGVKPTPCRLLVDGEAVPGARDTQARRPKARFFTAFRMTSLIRVILACDALNHPCVILSSAKNLAFHRDASAPTQSLIR